MADALQEGDLLHRYQFRGVRGRSALEAMFRAVVKAQRCMARGGEVAWGFCDVKGELQNVVKEEVMDRMSTTRVGWQW